MTVRTILVAFAMSVTPIAAHAEGPVAARAPQAVADAMREMFAALAVDDEARLRRVLMDDFYAFDGGHRMTADDLYAYVKRRHASGVIYNWSITEPHVHISGDLATITYLNRGAIADASGSVPMTWLEAAILHFDKGRWRIEFVDSTRTPLAPGVATPTITDTSPKPTYK